MAMRGSTDLDYTWYGVLVTDCDALLVLEQCLRGELAHIPRRPHDSERARLIKSGSIFVYESNASGIKRWTDGINWSPSRILSNFLVYHELEKAPPPGEKKRAIKRKRSETDFDDQDAKTAQQRLLEEEWTDDDRRLMGSPQDNYGWKTGGLVKKTYSFDFRGASHHIISYFNPEDVRSGELKRPIHCEEFSKTFIRPELIEQGARSRNPISESQIEQQRWERPLYQNDAAAVSLIRQYPHQLQVPYSAPGQILEFQTPQQKHAFSQPHNMGHRSSIHFPMEENLYHPSTASAYHPQNHPQMGHDGLHARHSSISAINTATPYQRPSMRDQLARAVPPIDTGAQAVYQPSPAALHHSRSQTALSALSHSPVGVKPEPVYEEDEAQSATYASVSQAQPAYVTTASPLTMPALDTSFSHAIARSDYPQAPHTTSHIHDSPVSHFSQQSIGPPPAKKGRIETAYPTFTTVAWEHPVSAPVTAVEMSSANNGHSGLAVQYQLEHFSFPQSTSSFSQDQAFAYSHAPASFMYNNIGPEFGMPQSQGMFVQGYSPHQLTASS